MRFSVFGNIRSKGFLPQLLQADVWNLITCLFNNSKSVSYASHQNYDNLLSAGRTRLYRRNYQPANEFNMSRHGEPG